VNICMFMYMFMIRDMMLNININMYMFMHFIFVHPHPAGTVKRCAFEVMNNGAIVTFLWDRYRQGS
jgi:hypothetical protein